MTLYSLLGLSQEKETIYKALIKYGALGLSEISTKTKIHRPRLYTLLPQMLAEQFVTESTVGKRKKYAAVDPQLLSAKIKKTIDSSEKELEKLSREFKSGEHRPTASLHYGRDGYTYLFDDIATTVPKGGTYVRYSSRKVGEGSFKISSLYKKNRVNKQIERKVITGAKKAASKSNRLDRFVKAVPPSFDLFEDNVSQMIYENKVAFVDHNTDTTFIIESEKIATFQRKLFMLLWKKL